MNSPHKATQPLSPGRNQHRTSVVEFNTSRQSKRLERNAPFIDRKHSNLREAAIRNHHKTNSNEQLHNTQLWVVKTHKATSGPIGITGLSFAQQVARQRYAVRNIPLYENASMYKVIGDVVLKKNAVASCTVIPHGVVKNDAIEDDVNGDAAGKNAVAKDSMVGYRFSKHTRIALLPTIHERRSVQNTTT